VTDGGCLQSNNCTTESGNKGSKKNTPRVIRESFNQACEM
jgi:hypothetical protein